MQADCVLVTGADGFIGGNIVRAYREGGRSVFAWAGDFAGIPWADLPPIGLLNHQAAITDPQYPDRAEVYRVNFRDALTLFEQAAAHGVSRVVYASSAAVYGNSPAPFRESGPFDPLTAYGESKLALDMAARSLDVPVIGLRYSNVWGPGEAHKGRLASMVRQIGLAMIAGRRPRLFAYGEQCRDFVHVADVVRANLLAGEYEGQAVLNIGAGQARTFNDLVAAWNRVLGTSLAPEYIPNPYERTYQARTILDNSKARRLLTWQPAIDFNEALAAYQLD